MLRCGERPAFFAAAAPFREVALSAITPLIRIITPGDRLELVSHIILLTGASTVEASIPMKQTQAEPEQTAPETPSQSTNAAPNYVTVYTFVIWDHDKGATAVYPRMATLEAIARMRGKVNEDTAWVVDASALDVEGFYSGGISSPT
jgi:hypothetical protein